MVVNHFPSTLGETRGIGKKRKTYTQQLRLALWKLTIHWELCLHLSLCGLCQAWLGLLVPYYFLF